MNTPKMVYWDTQRHKYLRGGEIQVAGFTWTLNNIPGKRCTECDLMMISGPSLPPKETSPLDSSMKKCVKCGRQIPSVFEWCQFCGEHQPNGK